jgi:hypothetical protein
VLKAQMRALLERRDAPAFWGLVLWLGLLVAAGVSAFLAWPSPWAIIPFAIYGVLYASSSDARWHEMGHGTAFKTDWMNNAVYELASFMVLRNATLWRWSHTRHHSDTIIVGRDPEIAVPRPPDLVAVLGAFVNLKAYPKYIRTTLLHVTGRLTPEELTFIPEFEHGKVILRARIYFLIYAAVIALAIYTRSLLPLLYIGLPNIYGAWLMVVYGFPSTRPGPNVLDHHSNCRTVCRPRQPVPVPEHELPRRAPHVPAGAPQPAQAPRHRPARHAHALQRLVELPRDRPSHSAPIKEPGWNVRRKLPTPTFPPMPRRSRPSSPPPTNGPRRLGQVCDSAKLLKSDVIRFDHNHRTYAIYRTADDKLYATDGLCTRQRPGRRPVKGDVVGNA